jgi:hypothetical protein
MMKHQKSVTNTSKCNICDFEKYSFNNCKGGRLLLKMNNLKPATNRLFL